MTSQPVTTDQPGRRLADFRQGRQLADLLAYLGHHAGLTPLQVSNQTADLTGPLLHNLLALAGHTDTTPDEAHAALHKARINLRDQHRMRDRVDKALARPHLRDLASLIVRATAPDPPATTSNPGVRTDRPCERCSTPLAACGRTTSDMPSSDGCCDYCRDSDGDDAHELAPATCPHCRHLLHGSGQECGAVSDTLAATGRPAPEPLRGQPWPDKPTS